VVAEDRREAALAAPPTGPAPVDQGHKGP
jgi:hypothetical protein